MDDTATLNVRMKETLKRHGSQVLQRSGVSPSELVRSTYRYMEREQSIPQCLDVAGGQDNVFARRRKLLAELKGSIHLPEPLDTRQLRDERIERKYGELL